MPGKIVGNDQIRFMVKGCPVPIMGKCSGNQKDSGKPLFSVGICQGTTEYHRTVTVGKTDFFFDIWKRADRRLGPAGFQVEPMESYLPSLAVAHEFTNDDISSPLSLKGVFHPGIITPKVNRIAIERSGIKLHFDWII